MKKFKLGIFRYVLVSLFVLVFSVSANAFDLGVRGYYWFPDLSGDFRVDACDILGTSIDIGSDLNVEDKSYPSAEVFAGIGKHSLNLMYTKVDYSGENDFCREIVFRGQTYTAEAFVRSDLELQMLDVEYQYNILDLENILAGFSVGLIGKVKYIEGEASLSAPGLGLCESESFNVPIPMVGLGIHAGLLADILEVRVRGAGIAYSGNSYYEGLAGISLTPFPFLDIQGGYKYMKLEIDDISDVFATLEFSGPYAAVTISF